MYGTYVIPYIYILPHLCAMQYFHIACWLARRRLIINVLHDTATNRECTERVACKDPNQRGQCDSTKQPSWATAGEELLNPHATTPVIVLWKRADKLYSLHHPDSIPHSWENPASTCLANTHALKTVIWGDSAKMWLSWRHRKPTTSLFVPRGLLATLQVASKCFETLLPAAAATSPQ